MSRLTGSEAQNLMEAYQSIYAPQEITEEQIWEEVENWVNSLIEEGYDLSEYTWEDMYEAYIDEQGRASGAERRSQQAQIRANRPKPGNVKADSQGNIFQRAEAERIKGANKLTQDARAIFGMDKNKPNAKTKPESKFGRLGRQVQKNAPKNEPMVLRGVDGKPLGKPPKKETTPSQSSPAPKPSTPAPKPSTPAPKPSTPAPTAATKTAPAPAKQMASRPKTPNPLMQKTFGYQTGGAPGQSGFKKATITPNVSGIKSGRLATALSGPNKKMKEGHDAYDIVLNYIAENGHAESLEEAHYIMMEMSSEMIQDIVETWINEGRRTSLSALSRESQQRKADKERGRPETKAETHGRLKLGKFSPGASKEERAEGGRERLRDRGKVPQKGGKDMFEQVLEHLISEGYADTEESAIQIIANMSEEWMQSIVEGAALQNTIKTLEGKRDKMNAENPGSANVSRGGKQSVGAAAYKAYQRLKGV